MIIVSAVLVSSWLPCITVSTAESATLPTSSMSRSKCARASLGSNRVFDELG